MGLWGEASGEHGPPLLKSPVELQRLARLRLDGAMRCTGEGGVGAEERGGAGEARCCGVCVGDGTGEPPPEADDGVSECSEPVLW